MIIRYLKLTNYRRFKHAELELPQGIIGIIGRNGAGKSTLVEAIAWALYGNQSEITRTSKGEVKRSGTSPKDPCSVELEFSLDGSNYRLIREIKGKAKTINAELYVNGELEARSARDTTDLIERRLGMDYKAFFASVFARQKELNALSSKQAGERKQLVLRMLNIEQLEKIKRSVGGDKRAAKNYLDGLRQSVVDTDGKDMEKKVRAERKELSAQLSTLEAEIEKIGKEKGEKEKADEQAADELEAYTKKYNEYKTLRSGFDKIEQSLAGLSANKKGYERELSVLESDKKQLGELEGGNQEYGEQLAEKEQQESGREKHSQKINLEKQLKSAEKKLDELKKSHSNFQKQFEFYVDLDDNIAVAEKARTELDVKLAEVNASLSRDGSALEHLNRDISERSAHSDTITDLGPESKCPTCERQLDEHHDLLLKKLKGEIADKSGEVKALEGRLKEQKGEIEKLEAKKKVQTKLNAELDKSRSKRNEIRVRVEGIGADIGSAEKELISVSSEIEALGDVSFDHESYKKIKSRIGELQPVHDRFVALTSAVEKIPGLSEKLKEAEAELGKTQGKRSDAEKMMAELGFDENKYEQLQERRTTANTDLQQAVSDHKLKTRDLKHVGERLEKLQGQLEQILDKKKQIGDKSEQVDYLTTLEQVFEKFKLSLISRIRPLLSQYGSEFLKKLTEGRYSQLELDENYDIYVYDEGQKYELKRYSGGEEDIANLSLRLAISHVIAESAGTTGLNMIILDEIFGSQDAYRKRNIISVLQELQNQYQQIFLITHVDEMKDQMGFVLDVKSDPDEDCSVIDVIS